MDGDLPCIADNPSVEGRSPRCNEHAQSEQHNDNILDQSPATSNAITKRTNKDLPNQDTNNLKISGGGNPGSAASFIFGPTGRPDGRKQWSKIADREKNVAETRQLEFSERCI